MLAKLLPLLVLGGISVHSSAAIQDRVKQVIGLGPDFVTKQRMGVILRAARLEVVLDGNVRFSNTKTFRAWIRKKVKIEKAEKSDPTKDAWGTHFRYKKNRQGLTIISAGKDKELGTTDDIQQTSNIYDY